jgi:hypothetical protein
MNRLTRIQRWFCLEAVSWLSLLMAVAGGVAIILFTGRSMRLCIPLFIAYEAMVIWSAIKWRRAIVAPSGGENDQTRASRSWST